MKNLSLQIEIPQPCHEKWEEMSPREQGRHCEKCARTLTDFTVMTDRQLLQFFEQYDGKLCGRFRADQLERRLYLHRPSSRSYTKWAAALGLGVLSSAVVAQSQESVTITQIEETIAATKLQAGIRGKVTDVNGEPLIGVAVLVKDLCGTTVTDLDGNFYLNSYPDVEHLRLVFSCTGYETKEVAIEDINMVTITKMIPVLLGEVVVTKKDKNLLSSIRSAIYNWRYNVQLQKESRKQRRAKRQEKKKLAKKNRPSILQLNSSHQTSTTISKTGQAKVYPNPASNELQLSFASAMTGWVDLQIVNELGQTIWTDQWQVEKGANQRMLDLEVCPKAGLYYLGLIERNGNKEQIPFIKI